MIAFWSSKDFLEPPSDFPFLPPRFLCARYKDSKNFSCPRAARENGRWCVSASSSLMVVGRGVRVAEPSFAGGFFTLGRLQVRFYGLNLLRPITTEDGVPLSPGRLCVRKFDVAGEGAHL